MGSSSCKGRICPEGDNISSASDATQSADRKEAMTARTEEEVSPTNEATGDELRINATSHEQYFVSIMGPSSSPATGSNITENKMNKEKAKIFKDAETVKPKNVISQANNGRGNRMLKMINKQFNYPPPVGSYTLSNH